MKNTKKGSYTIEAAIFIPVFIMAILTIGFFIKVTWNTQGVMHAIADEGRILAANAYVQKAPLNFQGNLEKRIMEDSEDITYVDIKNFKYLHGKNGNSGMISLDIKYFVGIKFPILFKDGVEKKDRILFRGFVGGTDNEVSMGFADMEKDEKSLIVYVFPIAGEKYHIKECTFISSHPVRVIFNKNIKKNYSPCKQCKPEKNKYGSIVYCFFKYGEAYHKSDCKKVDKYVVSMEKNEAKTRGYAPCTKCGGEK